MNVRRMKDRPSSTGHHFSLAGLAIPVIVTAFLGTLVSAQDAPVASFEPAAADAGNATDVADDQAENPAARQPAAAAVPSLSFNFRYAPWEDVLVKFADVAGLTLDLTETPSGTFNYQDAGRYTPREALDILNGYLLQRGFVLVRRDRFLVCANLQKGIPANLIPMITIDQLAEFGKNDLVSVILSRPGMDAATVASQFSQMQGAQGKVVSLAATNSLLVTDTASNVRLLQRLLEQGAFTTPNQVEAGVAFKSFALQHVPAEDAERLIRNLFGLPLVTSAADGPAAAPRTADLSISADSRTNRLFVTATSGTLASIEQIVTAFDVAAGSPERAPPRGGKTTRIVPLPNSDVIIVGRALEALSPRIRVSTTRSARGETSATPPPSGETGPSAGGPPAGAARPDAVSPQTPDGRIR